jgi:hypothetical protein
MKIHRGQYVREPLESSLPHIIVDSTGAQRLPPEGRDCFGQPMKRTFKTRAVATRLLNKLRRKPSPFIIGDPKTWTVQPVREA